MLSIPVNVTATATKLSTLINDSLPTHLQSKVGDDYGFRMDVLIQAPEGNGSDVNIGGETSQDGFISAGKGASFAKASLNHIYIVGTPGDSIVVLLDF